MPSDRIVRIILEDRALVQAVRTLDPAQLGQLVRHLGLEDSGEVLALATPEQLRGLADDELWTSGAGGDSLDPARFGTWVEVLLDAGPRVAADALEALDEDLLAHALSLHMLVLDLDQLAPLMADAEFEDTELAEKILESSLSHELDELLLLSLQPVGWDAIIDAIHELDRRDHAMVRRVLQRICDASMNRVAEDGLYSVLSDAETLAADARAGREDRRESRGFVSSPDARAFLELARTRPDAAGADPITRGYQRSYRPAPIQPADAATLRLDELLREVSPARPMLAATAASESRVRAELAELRGRDPVAHGRLVGELIYVANVLVSAHPGLSQVDAIDLALTFADAGDGAVEQRGLIALFAHGWHRAHSGDGPAAAALARLTARD